MAQMGPLFLDFLPKVLLSVLCGGIIGFEREIRQKPAGFRTNILICVGSALLMWMSIRIGTDMTPGRGDPGRIAAQVVTGIGFLGAGTILHSRGHITGMTSAAMIWVVSAIGMAVGAGYHAIAIFTTILILSVQVVLGEIERRLFGRCRMREVEVEFDDDGGRARKEIERVLKGQVQGVDSFTLKRHGDHQVLTVPYCVFHPQHRKFIGELWKVEGVREVRPLT